MKKSITLAPSNVVQAYYAENLSRNNVDTVNPLTRVLPVVATYDTYSAGGAINLHRDKNPWDEKMAGGVFGWYGGEYDYLTGLSVLSQPEQSLVTSNGSNYEFEGVGLDKQYNKLGGFQSEMEDFEIQNMDDLIKFGVWPSAGKGIGLVGIGEAVAPANTTTAMKMRGSTEWQHHARLVNVDPLPVVDLGSIQYVRTANRRQASGNVMIR
jgi:hypothetical protein